MRTAFYKRLLLLTAFIIIAFFANAQDSTCNPKKNFSNSVSITASNYYFPKLYSFSFREIFTQQFGFNFEHSFGKNFSLSASYSKWSKFLVSNSNLKPAVVKGTFGGWKVGSLMYRYKYQSEDLIVKYKYSLNKKNAIKIGLGISRTSGSSSYVDSIYVNPNPPHDGIIYSHYQKDTYWGYVPTINYDYLLIRNNLSVGADLRCRKYFGLYSVQIDYGIQLAFYF